MGHVLAAPGVGTLKTSAGELGYDTRGHGLTMRGVGTQLPLWWLDVLCPNKKVNLRATRAVELEGGLLMIVEATYPDGWRGDEAPALTRDNARCRSVRLVQLPGPLERGSWIMDAR